MGLKTKGQWGAGGALSGRVASRSEGTLGQRLECTQEPVHVGIWK